MKKVIILLSIIMFFFKTSVSANYEKKIYDFSIESITGEIINFKDYKNKAILIVNTASYCGFTKQYDELQELWDLFKAKGLIVLGVPSNSFNKDNHGKSAEPKWNFHKILINKEGKVEDTFASFTKPMSKKIIKAIENIL
jgi:glutathione peroxidase